MDLDQKDKALMDLLYSNSRMSFVQMGKKLRMSSVSVEKRLSKLKAAGLIPLMFANVNFGSMGLKSYRLYIRFDVMDEKIEDAVLKFFESYPRMLWGMICEGEFDVQMRFIAEDETEAEGLINQVLKKFGNRIAEKTLITTTFQDYLSWNKAFGTERREALPAEAMKSGGKLDQKDVKIISLLYSDSRAKTVDIAKAVGLSPDGVQARIRRLIENKYILGYTAWFDPDLLGFDYYKLLIAFRNMDFDKENEFIEYCKQNDSVVFINKTIGSWDIEADIIVRGSQDLHVFTRQLKSKFGNILGRYHFMLVIKKKLLNPLRGEK